MDDNGTHNRNDSGSSDRPRATTSHLDDIEDGCGCVELWEHLSEQRDSGAD